MAWMAFNILDVNVSSDLKAGCCWQGLPLTLILLAQAL